MLQRFEEDLCEAKTMSIPHTRSVFVKSVETSTYCSLLFLKKNFSSFPIACDGISFATALGEIHSNGHLPSLSSSKIQATDKVYVFHVAYLRY